MLMLAARNGNPQAVQVLLEAGVDVNARETIRGTTALMWAIEQKHPEAVKVLLAGGDFGRPMMVTPGTPPDRVKILRDAFTKTLNDPAAMDEAKKGRMDIDPASGEELEKLVKEIFDSPPDVVERVKKILGN